MKICRRPCENQQGGHVQEHSAKQRQCNIILSCNIRSSLLVFKLSAELPSKSPIGSCPGPRKKKDMETWNTHTRVKTEFWCSFMLHFRILTKTSTLDSHACHRCLRGPGGVHGGRNQPPTTGPKKTHLKCNYAGKPFEASVCSHCLDPMHHNLCVNLSHSD